jgi:hypothetical protein
VAEIVEPIGAGEIGPLQKWFEGSADEVVTPQRGARNGPEHQAVLLPQAPQPGLHLVLGRPLAFEGFYGLGGELDVPATLCCLGFGEARTALT